jgi:hypothetical protein
MTEDQLDKLWAFTRGDTPAAEFEQWSYAQSGLEAALGEDLHWSLLSGDYANRDEVWKLRQRVADVLSPLKQCECPTIPDLGAVPMGAEFYFEKVFETLEQKLEFGPDKWWLYLSKCRCCQTVWLIAQDDRIHDDYFMVRSSDTELAEAQAGRWPQQFQTYEDVLATGRKLSNPPQFCDPMAGSLQWTAEDLLKERHNISAKEIGYLLGLSDKHASALLKAAVASSRA